MKGILDLTAPLIILFVLIYGLSKGVDVYSVMLRGAAKGLVLIKDILPALLVLFPAIYMLRSSPALEAFWRILSPVLNVLGIPEETGLLFLLRPLSGSAALAAAGDIMAQYGADSLIGRTAAVMTGASETTLYVVAVYLAGAGVKDSRWAIPAALCADLVCFLSSAWICSLLWG